MTKSGNSPWVKLHRELLNDRDFIKLPPSSRFLYLGLLLLSTECGNKVYNDRTYIGQRLYIERTEIDLTPLYRSGLLEGSNIRRLLREREGEREEIEREKESAKPARASRLQLSDDEFIKSLKENQAYKHIDVDAELGKMDAWLSTRPGRKKSRPFVVNWLNKIEKPLKVVPLRPAMPSGPSLPPGEDCPPEVAEKLFKSLANIGGTL